jgi:hypothetical protein
MLRIAAHQARVEMKLVLTYDNTRITDGAGAQLQRIYGIYAIARLLGVSYLHSPLHRVDYQGLSALEANRANPDFHHAFNHLFKIESDVVPAGELNRVKLLKISPEILCELAAATRKMSSGPILVELALPYGISDRFPNCYEVCKAISPFASADDPRRALRIAIHVRRGELLIVASDRMLPNAYYVNVARRVTHVLDALGIDYAIELHTEMPAGDFAVEPNYPGIHSRIEGPAMIGPEMCRLDEFDVLPDLIRCINEPAIETLRKLAMADILIMSRSSFSYLGGLLKRNGITMYHPFWHRAPSFWIPVRPDGQFSLSRFRKAVEGLGGGQTSEVHETV